MSNRPLSAGSERLVAPPVRKTKPPSPASRPHSATSRPPSELRAGEVARVEYSGVPPRFSDPYARPSAESRPMSARSHTSLRSVSSVGSYELPPKPIISWGPGKPSPHDQGLPRRGAAPHVTGSSGAKAFKGLHDAMGESAWLDEKFRRSGAPEPEEGALTVVIEYCWNGDEPQESQMSTVHDLKRYHEEAMLTAAYIRRICPEAVVATIPSNFRGEPLRTRGEPKRLGAFEVDARFRVDGELQQTSLWSKLHTLQWPQWPAWQDVIRQSLSVFKLVLRPVALLADGSEVAVSETRLTVYNHNRSQVLLSCMVASGGGAQIKLLRGSYIVAVDETHDSYSEETSLTLTKAPLLSYEDIDIKVPIFMRPKLFVRLVTDWTADPPTGKPCPLGVSNCTATAMDVLFTVIDRSKAHNGDVLLQRRGPAQGLTSVLDLKQFRARVASMHTDLADQLWRASELGKHYGTPASLGASATGRSPGTAQAGISHLGDATGCTERPCGSANATMASAEEASVADVLSDVKSGLAQADLGWMVEVIATLPDFSHVMLDERLASTRVQLTKGGAPEVPLRLCRLTREVDVTVTAVQASGAWCRTLALPSMSIVARLASGGPPILRTAAEPAPLDGGGAPGQTMLARFPAGLEVGETYVISAEAATETADAAALHEVSEQVLVHPGNEPVVVQLLAERMCGSLLIEWLSFNMGLDHWTTKLPLPEGFVYNIRHQGSDTMVMSGRFSGALGDVASTEIPGAGIIFVGETYTIEISPGSGVQAQKVSAFVRSSAPTPVQVTLHRATAPVHVHLRSDMSSSGSWASTLPLPPGVVFEVWHSALQKRVVSGHADAKGYALIPDKEDLFINQRYELRAIESDLVCASSIEFIVNEAQAAVELLVPRRTVDINVQLESSVAASEHWAAPLLPPAGLTLRLIHKATKEVALIAESDAKAKVKLNGVNAIFVGEMYTLEAPADSRVKAASVDFIASKKADQVIKFAVDRTTSDVTLAVVARHPSGLPDYDRELGAPSGLKYDVCHKALGVQVATGYTDAVGKSVLRRKGTLFVGETYTIKVAGESSMQSGSCEFTVAPHHIETTLYVQRASADLSYEIVSVLAGSNHWAASLPIPATIPFEVRHGAKNHLIFSGVHASSGSSEPAIGGVSRSNDGLRSMGKLAGDRVGLYVVRSRRFLFAQKGETYRLCVAANELFEKSSAEFHVAPGGARCLLHLQRSFASVDVILKSVHAGTNHWAADLPLPTAVPFRVVHAGLGVVVASGSTNVASRATFGAEGGEFLVGESYRIDVVSSDAVTNSDEATFLLQSRATEVTKLVRRCCGRIEVGCRPGRASSGHWSSRVPLPDGISFNIYHKSLGCVVASGATSSSNHDSSPIKEEDALFVGETYICEVPKSNHVRAASREFKVTVEPQHVAVLVERACGQAVVHLNTSASLPVPEGTHLQLKHKGLDIAVLPPISVQGDRTELFGDDALLVGELYTLEALPHSSLLHSATEFMVLNQPFRIDLALERATGAVVLVFRSTGTQTNGNASMPRHGAVHWTNSLTLPAGVRYEVTHKGSGVVVVSGCTHHAEKCQRIVLDSSLLYVHEAYGLRVLPVHGVQAASCEFFVESTESQEVTLLLRRTTAPVSVSFHSIEFSSDHWAASLPLPSNVRFQLLHHETGAVVHKGDAGPSNRVAIPSTLMFIGEKYTLQTVESTLIRRATFDFVVRGGTDEQDVAVPIERNVGDAQVILHSADGRALPLGVPFQIRHCNLGCVVSEGRSTISDSRVVIDHWYVDQGALYVGEQYELTVPTGNGIKEATTIFVVDDKRVTVEMALTREHGQASVLLVNSKAHSGHWSEFLPLPKDMLLCVKLTSNPDVVLGSIHAQHAGLQRELLVSLTPDVDLMAHERYTIELQPSLPMLRSASELTIQSGDTPAVTELAVVRAWKPAVVVELRSSDAVALPAGLRIRVFHRDLRVEVAQADTEYHDVQVHCVVKASEAFFLGEPYVVSVESNYGVGAAEREFVMTQGNFGGGPDLCIELPRAAAQLWAVLFASLPSAEHWSSALTLPPQQLEVLHDKQLVFNSTVAWHKGDKEASCHISALTRVFVGHTYTIRVSESDAVHPLALPFVVDEGEKIAELPLRRKFFNLIVTLRSRDELPLPYGIKVLVRHKKLDTVVVSGMCGENEGSTFEDELEEAHAAHATLSAEQTAQAIEEVKSFMANNGVFFNGASDEDIESVTQAWSVHHTLRELREQNERTLDGIAAIMRDYENIALEVLGHTSEAQTATEALARFFGLDEYHDVEEIMNLLAEKRAEACRDALVERGVPYERLIVAFAGQSGAVRTDFIPCSMHNNAKLAMAATKLMRAQSKQGAIVFHAAVETRLSSASQAFTLEHMDPTILAQNRRTLENVAAVMMRYPHLQLHVHVETEAPATAPPILLHHFRLPASGGEDVTLAAMELLAGSRANAIVEALRSLGLHKGRVVGSCVGCAARASVTFTARTLEWRRNVFKHMDQSGGTSTAVALPESEQLGELAAQRSRVVFIKGIFNGPNTNYAAIHRPTSLSVRLDAPEALYPGEEYVVETIPAPSLGVPRVSREFLMPSHNEKLELWLDRPFGSVNVVLIDSKYGSNHWASSLPMPSSATIRVRHHSIGLVMPETEIQGSALVAHAPSKGDGLGLVTKQHPQTIAIQMADRSTLSEAVLRYALRSRLFVGERRARTARVEYNLEVIESDELAGTQVEFEVEFVDEQPVHVFVARKWRDLQVHVRYVEEMALLVPPVGLEIVARHKNLKIEASRGVTGEMGICNIPGADALFVGETYLLDLANDEGVSLKTTEVTIHSGTLPLVLDVKLGPAAAHITVVVEEAWHGDRSMYQGKLGIPSEIAFEIYSSPRLEKPKVQGTTNSKGVCELGRAAQLYVGREYIIEVTKDPAVEPFSKTFDVHPGKQEIKVQLKRACGPVTAVFMMQLAEDPSHWASSMALPWPINYRVVHKGLGLTVHTGELPKTSAQTHRMQLPSEGVLFANETYSIEVGFQAKDEVLEAERELRDSLRGRSLTFNSADEISLPAIEHAWSVEHLLDHRGAPGDFKHNRLPRIKSLSHALHNADFKENQTFLDTVASIMRAYECIHLEVFSEGEIVQVAPYRLAAYYKLDPVQDAQIIMEHLCKNRASACVDALRMRGVEHSRLRTRHSASGSTSRTIFTPVLPDGPFFVGDQRTGLALTSADFTVQRVPQDVVLRLAKSTGDMHIHFKSAYSEDPKHWSQSLQMPSGVRLRVMHTQRKVEVANGVVSGGGCFIAGAGKLFINEHYTVLLDESPFYTQSPSTVMLRQGMQSVPILVTWQARHVVCYLTSAERGARRQTLEDEAVKRVEQFMLNREISFNGAREAGLPSISQAWNVNHLDQEKCKQNLETLRGLANILLDYKDLKCRVHGDTGDAEEATRGLAEHFKLHHQRNVQEIMDLLARKRAESCRQALIQLGVPASQLFVTAKGRGGHLSVKFLPTDGGVDQMDALGQSIEVQENLLPLPRGVPYRMRLKSSGQIIFEGVTEMSGVVVSCPLPKSERFFVSQEYVFEALAGPGTEPNSVDFFLDPRQVHETDALEVKLPIRRVSMGQINVACKLERRVETVTKVEETMILTTGVAPWTLSSSNGRFKEGPAPTTPANNAWHQPEQGSWIGNAEHWPVGVTVFVLKFLVNNAEIASFSLPYSVDNKLSSALLNGKRLDIGRSQGSRGFGRDMVIRAPAGAGLFLAGINELELTVENEGVRASPMGIYLRGSLQDERSSFTPGEGKTAHWTDSLAVPQVMYQIIDASTETAVGNGVLVDTQPGMSTLLPTFGLQSDTSYRLKAVETKLIAESRPSEIFRLSQSDVHIALPVRRRLNMVNLVVQSQYLGSDHWTAALPLPRLFQLSVQHRDSDVVVQSIVVEDCKSHTYECALEYENMLVGESYRLVIGCTPQTQAAAATRKLDTLLARISFTFTDVYDENLKFIEDAWSVTDKLKAILRDIAELVITHPGIALCVKSEQGVPMAVQQGGRARAPERLAAYYKLAADEAEILMAHVARNRASACVAALIELGAERRRVNLEFAAQLNSITRTTFSVRANETNSLGVDKEGLDARPFGVVPSVLEFTVTEPTAAPQRVQLIVERATTDAELRLVNKRRNEGHWSSCLAVPNRIPVSIYHASRTQHGEEVISATVFDGSVRIAGAGVLFVDETYIIRAPTTIRNQACEATVVIRPSGTVMELPIERPVRLVNLRLLSERPTEEQDRQMREARRKIQQFVAENDVFFNGAAEQSTKASMNGIAQAWNIDHLDTKQRENNWKTIRGIAAIMREFPDVVIEVHGSTGNANAAPAELAEHFRLDRTQRVQEIMDRLAKLRAEACMQALVQQGVPAKRLWVTYKGRGGQESQKADFIAHTSRNKGNQRPLPAGIPFRLLHLRRYDNNLHVAMSRVRDFLKFNDVHFNGAGEDDLPSVEQAWNVDHLDANVRHANRRTIEGIAAIMREFEDLSLEVHGETGKAHIVPERLAAYFKLSRTQHLQEAMDQLAHLRAMACVEAITRLGVDKERLFVTYKGLGEHIRTDFIPHTLMPYAPMPPGDFGECAIILEGKTTESGDIVKLPLQPGAALYVDETYVLQVSTERGNEPPVLSSTTPIYIGEDTFSAAYTMFGADAESSDPNKVVTADLQLSRIERGTVSVRARYAKFGTSHWSASLDLPSGVQYSVVRVSKPADYGDGGTVDATVQTGTMIYSEPGHLSAVLTSTNLRPGEMYEVRVPSSDLLIGASTTFEDTSASPTGINGVDIPIVLDRVLKEVRVRWQWPEGAWYAFMELPHALPYVVRHKNLKCDVVMGILRRNRKTLKQQVEEALARVQSILKNRKIVFYGANDTRIRSVEEAWRATSDLDDAVSRQNHSILDEVAKIISSYPQLGFEVVGETGVVDEHQLSRLAEHFMLEPREHASYLLDLLANNRASSCVEELVRRGIDRTRLVAMHRSKTGSLTTEFVPQSMEVIIEHRKAERARVQEQARSALRSVMNFMEEHDVVFNGARNKIPSYRLGAAQTWSVYHVDEKRRASNLSTLDGIAKIMRQYPRISCEVQGMTRPFKDNAADEKLAEAFGLNPITDSSEVFLELARRRAKSCAEYLQMRGIAADRLTVSGVNVTDPNARDMKVDFKPHVDPKDGEQGELQYMPIPLDMYEPAMGTIRDLLTNESYELSLAQTEERLYFEQASTCDFEVHGGPSVQQISVNLMPLPGRVVLRVESDLVGKAHWSRSAGFADTGTGLQSQSSGVIAPVVVEVIHDKLQVRVMEGTISPPGGELDGRGSLFVGESYTLITRDSNLEEQRIPFTVKQEPTELRLHYRERETMLIVVLESKSAKPLPKGIRLALRAKLPASHAQSSRGPPAALTLLELQTDREGKHVEVPLPQPQSGCLLMNMGYVIDVLDGGEGGVSGVSHEFVPTEERTYVNLRLEFNAQSADLHLRWLGPLEGVATRQTGDGEVADTRTRALVRQAIQFKIFHRATNELKLSGSKTASNDETIVHGKGKIYVGQEYIVMTEPAGNWDACSQIVYISSSTSVVELNMHRVGASSTNQNEIEVALRIETSQRFPWASRLPVPSGLGFIVAADIATTSSIVEAGVFDPTGKARFRKDALASSTRYHCKLAQTVTGSSNLVQIDAYTFGAVEPCDTSFVAPTTAQDALVLPLKTRRRTRSVRLSMSNSHESGPLPRLQVRVLHAGLQVQVYEAITEGTDDIMIPGEAGLFIGEKYIAKVSGSSATQEPAHSFTVQSSASLNSVQEESFDLHSPQSSDVWPDEFETRPDVVARIHNDANRLDTATRGLWTDYRAIAEILGTYSASEMQLLRRAYASVFTRELGEDLRKRSSILKSKAGKLEQLVVRSGSELDALTVRAAVQKKALTTELYEMLCTSMPHSLLELQTTYSIMYNSDAAADIERISSSQPSSSTAVTSNPARLLTSLLRDANQAIAFSNATQVEPDVGNLHQAFLRPTYSETFQGVVDIFSRRTRAHLREVASSYKRLIGVELKVAIKGRFGGNLQRALLLLIEPSDEYFAHKLHGGFFGLKKTPELSQEELLGSANSKLLARVQVTHGFAHMDTVVMVVATRFGRDLSMVAEAYHRLYGKTLVEDITYKLNYNFRCDLCRLLVSIVESAAQRRTILAPSTFNASAVSSSLAR